MTRLLAADDLYAITVADDPRISPDGSRIVYVRTTMDRDTHEYRRTLWLIPAQGGEPRQLTSGPNDAAPRWSPDGSRIAFVRAPSSPQKTRTKKEAEQGKGQGQIWVLSLEGGEPQQITSMRYGVSAPEWSPDGETIAFSARTGEPEEPDVEEAAYAPEERHLPRVRTIRTLWHKLDGAGFTYEHREHIFTIPAAGGEPRQWTEGDYDNGEPDWSPDGSRIAFTSDRTAERWKWPGASVWVLNTANGSQTRLTDEALACHAPKWSPDGQTIAFLAAPRRHGVGHTDLYVVPAGAPGKQHMLSGDFVPTCDDTCIDDLRAGHGGGHLTWSPDGKEVYFLASMRGTTHVYAAHPFEDLLPRRMTDGPRHVYAYSLDTAGRTIAMAVSAPTIPGDIYMQPATRVTTSATGTSAVGSLPTTQGDGSAEPKRLTQLSKELLDEVELARPEEYTFLGVDGWELQGWILRPTRVGAGEEVDTPAILEVHGGPAAMYGYSFFMEFQLLVAHGYTVVYTNPRGSTGYGRIFSGAVINDWGGKDYQDILAGLDAAIARGGIDATRLGVAGGSYGGYMTNWVLGHSDRFKAGVTMRSVTNMATMFGVSDIGWELTIDQLGATPWGDPERLARFSPITYVENIHAPLLILHSDNDLRCPIEEALQLYSALKYLDRETELVIFEEQTHDLSRNGHPRSRVIRLQKILDWFEKYVPTGTMQD